MKVGFIGLGQMGRRMAKNVLKSGYALTVFNRSEGPVLELAREGAAAAASSKEVGARSDVVILCLPTPEVVKQVILGPEGVAEGLGRGGVVMDTSTTDPVSERELETELKSRGISLLDAPVSGGPEGAEKATLTFMVGGKKAAFERCRPIFDSMGRNVFYLGASGNGQGTKLVNQILVASHTVAAAEAMLFGASLGLDPEQTAKAIQVSAGDSFIFRRTAPKMSRGDFGSGWQTYLIHKDLGLILKTAGEMGCPMIQASLARELFSASMGRGLEKVDAASVVKVLERMSGVRVSRATR